MNLEDHPTNIVAPFGYASLLWAAFFSLLILQNPLP